MTTSNLLLHLQQFKPIMPNISPDTDNLVVIVRTLGLFDLYQSAMYCIHTTPPNVEVPIACQGL